MCSEGGEELSIEGALMERALEPTALDALFRKHAERQYEKEPVMLERWPPSCQVAARTTTGSAIRSIGTAASGSSSA